MNVQLLSIFIIGFVIGGSLAIWRSPRIVGITIAAVSATCIPYAIWDDPRALLEDLMGGILVSILIWAWTELRHYFANFNLQRLVGAHFLPQTDFKITYGQLLLMPISSKDGLIVTHPYYKPPRRGAQNANQTAAISIEFPVSECEVRAAVT